MAHPLDRPIWSSLTGRQAAFGLVQGGARRFAPEYGVFAAVADTSPVNLAALGDKIRAHGDVANVEAEPPPPVAGATVISQAVCWQMVAERLPEAPPAAFPILPLSDADAPEMLALATLTRPGPFLARTHQLGDFVGVKEDGRLVAMAGERMRPDGFTEVSGVCTHPDRRGRGYAAGLMRHVAARIRARGETPFLHAYASNTGAIGLYESLGFVFRRELVMTTLTRD